jgi:hypothetical protein
MEQEPTSQPVGQDGWQQLMAMGQQPRPVMLPKQTGVNALYGRQQMVVEYVQQQRWHSQAKEDWADKPTAARLRSPITIRFILMGVTVLRSSGRTAKSTILMEGARPCSTRTLPPDWREQGGEPLIFAFSASVPQRSLRRSRVILPARRV